jgi:DNA-binding CsgD family transcriptional regulator
MDDTNRHDDAIPRLLAALAAGDDLAEAQVDALVRLALAPDVKAVENFAIGTEPRSRTLRSPGKAFLEYLQKQDDVREAVRMVLNDATTPQTIRLGSGAGSTWIKDVDGRRCLAIPATDLTADQFLRWFRKQYYRALRCIRGIVPCAVDVGKDPDRALIRFAGHILAGQGHVRSKSADSGLHSGTAPAFGLKMRKGKAGPVLEGVTHYVGIANTAPRHDLLDLAPSAPAEPETAAIESEERAHLLAADLSDRQQEILAAHARYDTDEEIASSLGIAVHTVASHRSQIKGKLMSAVNSAAPFLVPYRRVSQSASLRSLFRPMTPPEWEDYRRGYHLPGRGGWAGLRWREALSLTPANEPAALEAAA